MRWMGDGEIWSTIPAVTNWSAIVVLSQWLTGWRCCSGSVQARSTTCNATSGGKPPRATRPGPVMQTGEALAGEAVEPVADDRATDADPRTDVADGETVGGQQHDACPAGEAGRRRGT